MEKNAQAQDLEEQALDVAAFDHDQILDMKDNILHIEALETVTPRWESYRLASDN